MFIAQWIHDLVTEILKVFLADVYVDVCLFQCCFKPYRNSYINYTPGTIYAIYGRQLGYGCYKGTVTVWKVACMILYVLPYTKHVNFFISF